MSHPLPGSGWLFVTKKDPSDTSNEDSETYPVAYFEDGVPWFATPTSSVLRQPSRDELYWGCLVSPGQNAASMWRETVAKTRHDLRVVTEAVTGMLQDPEIVAKGGLSQREIQEYVTEVDGFHPAIVCAALRQPQFSWASETGVPLIRLMEGH